MRARRRLAHALEGGPFLFLGIVLAIAVAFRVAIGAVKRAAVDSGDGVPYVAGRVP